MSEDTEAATADRITASVGINAEDHRGQLRMAERLAQEYTGRLLHVHEIGWHVWTGKYWAPDRDGGAMRNVRDTLKAGLHEAAEMAFGSDESKKLYTDVRTCESAAGMKGVLGIASCLDGLSAAPDRLNEDPHLFNCTMGTIDLRNGAVRDHSPADLITKIAGCGFGAAPTFERFLGEILPDEEVRAFVQRLLGYAMLGTVREHVMAIWTGSGKNGKSTLIETVKRAFGGYGITAEPELLLHREGAHPTGQADLMGVRLAVISETGEGQKMSASTVKRLCGGDTIRARRMRQDFIEFAPSHTLIMLTNFAPKVPGDDPALWRRLLMVPFDVVIAEPDPSLPEQLALELDGVLTWLYEGYRAYHQIGLAPPGAVTRRTAEYQASSDVLARFLDERTQANVNSAVGARELYGAWSTWCQGSGEEGGSEVVFAAAMARHGHAKRKSGSMIYPGLLLLSQ
ncbi:phage/plasmid primase, P4 family [Streptomyces sp. MZ04]|uniref:DNA primase family protein n=1 Tax=Streptomyces sp. MZ04 TaxID=2559236 RepID=UPI0014329338|nr:phage/plasmid primase, P4 family [Streptomyces sp. MZ04]